jgi:uncharacterized protein YjiS (DUF1127 family)
MVILIMFGSGVTAAHLWHRHRRRGAGSTGPSVVDMVIATTKAGFRAVARWRSERRAVEHLRSLSDHQLRDLGITRDQVIPVVLGQKNRPGARFG